MAEKDIVVEYIVDEEELPSDVNKRIFKISALSDDEKERFTALMGKLDTLLSKVDDTQSITNILELKSRLIQMMTYMSKLEEKLDMFSIGKNNQDFDKKIDYVKDELKDYIAALSDEIQASKRSFLAKLEEFKQSLNVTLDASALEDVSNSINTSLAQIKNNMDSGIRASVSDVSYDMKTTMSDIADDVKLNVAGMLTKNNAELSDVKDDIKQHVLDISTRFYELETSLNSKMEIIKSFMEQSSENIDKTLTALYVIRDVINKSSDTIDVSAENLRDASINLNEKMEKINDFIESVDNANENLMENVKTMNSTRNDVDEFVTKVDKKTDDILNVVYSKTNDLGKIKDELKVNIDELDNAVKSAADINVKLEDSMTLLDDLRAVHKKGEKNTKATVKKINKTLKDLQLNDKDLKKSLGLLKFLQSEAKKKETINKDVLGELKRFNIRLSKMDEAEFWFRVFTIKKQIKRFKKLPKWAAERRDLLHKSVILFEDELTDLTIIYALLKGDSSFSGLRKLTGIGENKLKDRLKRLVDEKRVNTHRKGRFVIYSITA